jgi:sugar transferase (PEP-CTERM/EpsH1 system associated)
MSTSDDDAARPRVLHVMDSLVEHGMELALLRLIQRTHHEFAHFICCVRELGARPHRFAAAGAEVTFIGKSVGQDWRVPWHIGRLCRTLRPDIVHTRNWGTIEGTLTARLARVPVVIHGEHGRETPGGSASDRRRDRMRRLAFRFVDRIVVVSSHLERWARDEIGIRPQRTVLIRNGVDTSRFQPPADRERLRRTRGYGPEDIVIGAVGRLCPVKDHATLIAAFERVLRREPAARLLLVGEGPERRRLEEEIGRRGLQAAARLAGHQRDVAEWLGAMDVFVQPSLMEGTSNAVLEAMAVGLPVVATRVGGNPEAVVDGLTGRLAPLRDAAALATAIEGYAHGPAARRQHGAAGRARVARHYALDDMIAAYTFMYRETLARRSARLVGAPCR